MNSLNSILIEGNLTRDPNLKQIPSGTYVCSFSIAINRYWKQNEERQHEVSYFDIEAWAMLGERCGHYLKKGRGVRVTGRLKQDRWNNAAGKPHARVKIIAEHVEFRDTTTSASRLMQKQPVDGSLAAESPF